MSIPAGQRVELVLYISAASPASVRAVVNAKRLLREYKAADVDLTICDLTKDPSAGDRDQIAFTPTLCKRAPEPPLWILGDLAQPGPLIELLEFYGVQPTHGNRKAHHRNSRV